jgi:hypothetical protein
MCRAQVWCVARNCVQCERVCANAHPRMSLQCLQTLQTPMLDFVGAWWLWTFVALIVRAGLSMSPSIASGADRQWLVAVSLVDVFLAAPLGLPAALLLCRCQRRATIEDNPGLLTSGATRGHCRSFTVLGPASCGGDPGVQKLPRTCPLLPVVGATCEPMFVQVCSPARRSRG